METPYLCTVLVHKFGRRKSKKNWSSLFLYKLFLFTLGLAYVRINTSSNELKMVKLLKIKRRGFFNKIAVPFCVTHCENSASTV